MKLTMCIWKEVSNQFRFSSWSLSNFGDSSKHLRTIKIEREGRGKRRGGGYSGASAIRRSSYQGFLGRGGVCIHAKVYFIKWFLLIVEWLY